MRNLILIGLIAALAGCGSEPSRNASLGNEAIDQAATPGDMDTGPAPVEQQPEANTTQPEPTADVIPAALRGRWGLVPADCTSTRGDAKGLLAISDTQLSFYESRGTLRDLVESDSSRIVADFDFMGEGQTWQRRMVLDAQDGGDTLVRRDYGEDAMPGALRYQRCDAG